MHGDELMGSDFCCWTWDSVRMSVNDSDRLVGSMMHMVNDKDKRRRNNVIQLRNIVYIYGLGQIGRCLKIGRGGGPRA